MSEKRILIAESEDFSDRAQALLTDIASIDRRVLQQEEIRRAMEEYHAIWIRLRLQVREADIPERPRCRFVVTATTGVDHLDIEALGRAGVRVLSLRGEKEFLETINVTAEFTLAMILALVRRLPSAVDSVVKQGRWDRNAFRGVELYGKTAGIVGLGRLGRKVAVYLQALGMRIIAFDPYSQPTGSIIRMAASLDELLQEADVVTVHVPLNDETRGMFDAGRFRAMKAGAFFVNTSRGAVVDEAAFLESLSQGHLAGAALDVLCGEPLIDGNHPLVQYAARNENLIITPHIGGAVEGVMERCEEHMAELLRREMS